MISIIMPCYNDNNIVRRAIASVLAQRYAGEYEIILVDDGSDIPITIDSDRVRIIRHEQNRGLSAALNTGIEASNGTHWVILSSDDQLRRDYLVKMSRYMHYFDIVSSDFQGDNRKTVRCVPGSLSKLMKSNCHSYAALINKKLYYATGGYKETMNPSWEDWEFFLNCAKLDATWKHVSEPLHIYHRNPIGRDAESQNKTVLLRGKLEGYHQDLFGVGNGVVVVVIPCYHHEMYLRDAYESALNQIYPHVKVVVVNDGSSQMSRFDRYIKHPDVHVVHQRNSGLPNARNTGILYALKNFNPQYLVMLDADDTLHPMFIEDTMANIEARTYVYTDVQFIGDAKHKHQCEDYSCETLIKKHLHACTFLMQSRMLYDIFSVYGSFYDETMTIGYEDWEFALRALRVGWCGHRLKRYLFNYRYHENGSMRIKATKKNKQLSTYISSVHKWVNVQGVNNMCCNKGGGRYTSTLAKKGSNDTMPIRMISIPNIGDIPADTPLAVKYKGLTTSTVKKIGTTNILYRYSSNENGIYGPNFTAIAADYHLFVGPFDVQLLSNLEEVKEVPIVEPTPLSVKVDAHKIGSAMLPEMMSHTVFEPTHKEKLVVQPVPKIEDIPMQISDLVDDNFPPDDLTKIKYIGIASQKRLFSENMKHYENVADANAIKLAAILSVGVARANEIIVSAEKILEELTNG